MTYLEKVNRCLDWCSDWAEGLDGLHRLAQTGCVESISHRDEIHRLCRRYTFIIESSDKLDSSEAGIARLVRTYTDHIPLGESWYEWAAMWDYWVEENRKYWDRNQHIPMCECGCDS